MTVTIRGYPPETKSQYHGVWVGGCEGCGWVWVGVGGGCVCILVWASTNCRLKYFTSFLLPVSLPSLLSLTDDPRRWCTIRLGEQKHQLRLPVKKEPWHATFSFLVCNLLEDSVSGDVSAVMYYHAVTVT